MAQQTVFGENFQKFISRLYLYYRNLPRSLTIAFFLNFCTKSQAEKVYWHLQNFGSITNLQCHENYSIRHAPSVIRDIRKRLALEGNHYMITNKPKKGCNMFGKPCNWVEYTLERINNDNE